MKNVIFIAPPAAGKGTISDYLVENLTYTHISTGDILRNMASEETELGKTIKELMKEGKFISDDIILPAFEIELKKLIGCPFILDGMPRNLNQAQILDEIFARYNVNNYVVINIDLEKEILETRITGRRICENCHTVYNIYFDEFKPSREDTCDKCNNKLVSRKDDSLETYQTRYEEYIKETMPLIDYYKEKGVLKTVKANRSQQEIINEVINIVKGDKND